MQYNRQTVEIISFIIFVLALFIVVLFACYTLQNIVNYWVSNISVNTTLRYR